MKVVIIGGSSGLGLAMAKRWHAQGASVAVTGRTEPRADGVTFYDLDLSQPDLPAKFEAFVSTLPQVDLFVYAAGYYQEGRVTDLTVEQIENMLNVGGRGLIFGLRALLNKQATLPELITITSSSQWTPRQLEPIYNFVKAGAGHFTNAMVEDGRVTRTLHLAPSGMKTPFWRDDPGRDMSVMLDPEWVVDEIEKIRGTDYRYKYVRILRGPGRTEEVETR